MAKVLTFKAPDVVRFDHCFFTSFPDACFRIDESEGVPVFAFWLGQQQVALPFVGIKRELAIREYSHDALMLNTIEQGLRFVSLLKIGDPVPQELLTRDASWLPTEVHRTNARNCVGAQLVAWRGGHRVDLSEPIGLEKFVAHYVNDITVGDALEQMAIQLGRDGDGTVADVMTTIVKELAYIETLRERHQDVSRVADRLQELRREFAHHAGIMDDAEPVTRLISLPIRAMTLSLAEVDARLSSIMSLFCDFEFHRSAIREIRDEMYTRLGPWQEIVADWPRLSGTISDPYAVVPLLRDLYRFLALRFMPAETWALMLAKDSNLDDNRQCGSVVTWFERESNAA